MSRDIISIDTLPLGLGCSRLGSVNGASGREAKVLLQRAFDLGIRFFDTSNVYGQGDSEKLIGEALGRHNDCVICSKAGKYFPWPRRMLVPLKGVLRGVTRRSQKARRGIASARAKPMPSRWDEPFLLSSIHGSLRRLKRDRIDVFMLHSPPADILALGEALDVLEKAQVAGKIGIIGASVDDVPAAEAALPDPRIRALQLPLLPGNHDFDGVVRRAAENDVAVIAREILGGAATISATTDPAAFVRSRVIEMIRSPEIALPLVGTTRPANLFALAEAAREGMSQQ
ncbi:aldo/keto reductase [Thiorhodococcus fuscus]|uniref:Aldo/keto reductase n=1 Tax=Thiorhodococcus fuscus TaxID=527200 RepID=A0ABW4YB95_9GAMM